MTPAALLAILVATGEAGAAPTTAMAAAAGEVVGAAGAVRVVEASVLTDAESLRVERELGVRAVVTLTWGDAARLHARLRLHAARTDRWIDRELDFSPGDGPAERGRALGFAMASMLPEGDPTLSLATPEPPTATPQRPPGATAFEASFVAAMGIDGPAGGLGGRLAIERFIARRASLVVSVAGREERLDSLDAREVTASAGVGGALWAMAPASNERFGLALRGEALLFYEAVAHDDAAGGSSWKGHPLPGAALGLVGTVRVADGLEAFVSAGAELAFGTIDVTVVAAPPRGGTVRIPPERGLAACGLRARF
jgi:hypothetical protein